MSLRIFAFLKTGYTVSVIMIKPMTVFSHKFMSDDALKDDVANPAHYVGFFF